jgi:chromosome segregation ATPase
MSDLDLLYGTDLITDALAESIAGQNSLAATVEQLAAERQQLRAQIAEKEGELADALAARLTAEAEVHVLTDSLAKCDVQRQAAEAALAQCREEKLEALRAANAARQEFADVVKFALATPGLIEVSKSALEALREVQGQEMADVEDLCRAIEAALIKAGVA